MNIEQLAQQMNVSAHDVMMMARSMANSIDKDGAAGMFVGASQDDQAELVKAYAPVAARKMEQITTKLLTSQEARSAFQHAVIAA